MIENNEPTLRSSAIVLAGILLILIIGLTTTEASIHVLLLASIIWTAIITYFKKNNFKDIKSAMNDGIARGLTAIYIFILIGVLVAALIASGTIPTLIYYGLGIINPAYFLPTAMIICTMMSLATGTSWGTVGTVGIVLIGLGTTLNIPPAVVAGAIVSGAVFGDKMSPISDMTVLASVSANAEIFRHIRTMLISTIPAFVISFAIYLFYGMTIPTESITPEKIESIRDILLDSFDISVLMLSPIFLLLYLSIRGVAAEVTMIASILLAILLAIAVQHISLNTIFDALQSGYISNTGDPQIDKLLSRGGIQSVMWTMSLVIIAFALGGILDKFKYISTIMSNAISRIEKPATLITTTIFSTIFFNLTMSAPYLSIVLGGQLFKDAFKKMKLHESMLSRCLEEGATCTGVIIPWTAGGAFFMSMLDVSVFDYAPWAFFNILNPIISITLSYIGIGMIMKTKEEQSDENLKPRYVE